MSRRKKRNNDFFKQLLDTTEYSSKNIIPKTINLDKQVYLSYDVATKSLAYSILEIPKDIHSYLYIYRDKLNNITNKLKTITTERELLETTNEINSLKIDIKNTITLLDSSVDILVPEKKDKDITEMERIRAIIEYYNTKIKPKLVNYPNIIILIEYQMTANQKAHCVQIALMTLLADYPVHIVKPIYKNRINIGDHWVEFVKKYSMRYTANKRHAIYNFELLRQDFNCNVEIKKTQISHIADAFMQTLAFYKFQLT